MSIWSRAAWEAAPEAPTGDPAAELDTLRAGRAVLARDPSDRFDLTGADALDLVHRLAASAVADLAPGQAVRAVFTDDKGHLVDVPLLCSTGESLALLCGPGRAPDLAAWIDRFIIAEDVQLVPSTGRWALGTVGETALEGLAEALDQLTTAEAEDQPLDLLLAGDAALGPVLGFLEAPADRADQILTFLEGSDLSPVGSQALRVWAMEIGRALPGPALAAGPNPLEVGLKPLISFTKGCYVGQEVVARLDTYDKVRRRVTVATVEDVPPPGSPVRRDGKAVGRVLDAAPALHDAPARALLLVETSVPAGAAVELVTGAATLAADSPTGSTPA